MAIEHHFHPAELSLDCCIKCNICTAACPVTAVTDRFPGPKYVGPQAGRFREPGQPSPDSSVDYCSGCRVCNMVCPSGVKIAEMNARARAVMVEQGRVPLRLRARNNLIARSELLGKLGQPVAPFANALLGNGMVRQLTELTLGIAREAPLPTFAGERFTRWFRRRERSAGESPLEPKGVGTRASGTAAPQRARGTAAPPTARGTAGRVVYFHGCATEYYEPRVGRAAVRVLEHNGFEVIVPPQNCCGLPLLSNGEFGAARAYHERNVRSLVEYARQGVPIVGTSTSCILTLKEEAPELLDMFDEDTQLVARQSFDLHEFLLDRLEEDRLDTDFRPIPLRLPYHPPCQYRAHRLGRPAAEIMALIPQLEIVESHAACCGIGGTYGYKVEKYDIAMQVGRSLFDFVEEVGGPLVVCDSETCRWQITHGTGKPAVHPVELLALAYGYPAEGALANLKWTDPAGQS